MPLPSNDVVWCSERILVPACRDATIDGNDCAGDVAGIVGSQEVKRGGDLRWLRETTERGHLADEGDLGVVRDVRDRRREHGARADAVHGDAAWREFDGAELGQVNDGRLRGRVSRSARRANHADEGAGVDDASTALQQLPPMFDAEGDAVHVYLEGALKELRCEFVKGHAERLNACVVDEDVHATKLRLRPLQHAAHDVFAGDIGLMKYCAFDLCFVAIHEQHFGACFDEAIDDSAPDTGRATRDDGDFVGQVKHGGGPLWMNCGSEGSRCSHGR